MLGIVSIVGCFGYGIVSIICGPLAIYFGARPEGDPGGIRRSELRWHGHRRRVCGIIGTCTGSVGILILLFYAVLMVIAVVGAGAAGP